MRLPVITILGGTGFLGRYIVKELAPKGYYINIVTRNPSKGTFLKTAGFVAQISLIAADVNDYTSLSKILQGSDIIINTIGILHETRNQTFEHLHTQLPHNLAKIAKQQKCKKLIHLSALGVDQAVTSQYACSKLKGEELILKEFPQAIIVRPGIMFGQEDKFFNKFANLTRFSPFLPLFYQGKTKFQPVYVVDVAKAISNLVLSDKFKGKILECVGSNIYTFRNIMQFILRTLNKRRILLAVPNFLANILALISQFLPTPIITKDQLELLKYDNIANNNNSLKLEDLGLQATSIDEIVPNYIARFK